MVSAQAIRGGLGNLRFAEIDFWKNHGERLNVAVFAASQSGNGGRVDSTAQEYAQRNVGDQVLADGAFQEQPQPLRRSRGGSFRRVARTFQAPVRLRLRCVRLLPLKNLHPVSGR